MPLLRVLAWLAFAGWLGFVALVLALRYLVLPSIGDYRERIEVAVSQAVGQTVRVGKIDAYWRGLNPELVLNDLSLLDSAGEAAFTLRQVDGVLSWESLWRGRLVLDLLVFERPVLHVRRDIQGRISVAGMASEGESDPAFLDWVLAQKRIRIHDASIVWEDTLRQAPPLILEDLQFGLDNQGKLHRFGLSAAPPAELAARIDLRGEVEGDIHQALEQFAGRLYVELAYADLAGWSAWIDYPVDLPQGRGGLRLWGDLEDGAGRLVTDLALESVQLRLGPQLPLLDLESLRGRLRASYSASAWSVAAKQLELATRDSIRLVPMDFQLDWRQENAAVNGQFKANLLDLAALSRLANYLPLDVRSRQLLQNYAPQGRIAELQTRWTWRDEALQHYALSGNFAELGVRAVGYFPGAQGLSGKIDANEAGGSLTLDTQQAGLSLPAVFPEPDIVFDRLQARVAWRNLAEEIAVDIEKLAFSGPDATGEAHGNYRYTGKGPGLIDLQATIDRADGRAVWRYMPHVVNADARTWLKYGILAGTGYDAKLILRGDLYDFPFREPSTGKFLVTAKARDVVVDYADDWPRIEGIAAEMAFDYGMRVNASAGQILGASLSGVSVVIPDFDASDELLLVKGRASGPTAEFLKFIDQSPVAGSIDHFTDGMKAMGNGRLDLELDIPLRRPLQTRMRGNYHFQDNQVHLVEGLPWITQVNGRLDLTEGSISASGIQGRAFGGPLRVQVSSASEGKVAVNASGNANMADVAKHFAWPLVDQLSGKSDWKAEIGIQKRQAQVRVTSDLIGVSSPLPEPLNKVATEPLPLRVERLPLASGGDAYEIRLGDVLRGNIQQRDGQWQRGALALGDAALVMPPQGLAVAINLPHIDVDRWRHYLPATGTQASGSEGGLTLAGVTVKTPKLTLQGQDFQAVKILLTPLGSDWKIGLSAREAEGELRWRESDEGWLEGRLQRLHLNPAKSDRASPAADANVTERLPGLRLSIDDFRLGDKALGQLALLASNKRGVWQLDRLNLRNPDGELSGTGRWTRAGIEQTDLSFNLTTPDAGRLLRRLGYDEAMREGRATLVGRARWNGSPVDIDYASLSGEMDVLAEKGQFNKLEPGVGRLLGLISLQSLPRRLTLDFRDLFSEGLAFDRIEGKLAIQQGIMRTTDSLRINGPAVQVVIDGEANLQQETQDLLVRVRPEVSMLAIGAATLVNPVAGAAALVANTMLQSPLNQVFSYRYRISGNWADPQVEKQGLGMPGDVEMDAKEGIKR